MTRPSPESSTESVSKEAAAPGPAEPCPRCEKRLELCFCSEILALPTRLRVLVLRHPQEPDRDLGTAKLAALALENSQLRVGLSWPNLRKALGQEVENRKWGVLYLGSGIAGPAKNTPGAFLSPGPAQPGEGPAQKRSLSRLFPVSRNGSPLEGSESDLILKGLEGIVLLDGTWTQAKALWWRNAWLLKLQRLVLIPGSPSLYGALRKEPRRECLSTLETIAESLRALGESPEIPDSLIRIFRKLLQKERDRRKLAPAKTARPKNSPKAGPSAPARGRWARQPKKKKS